MKKSIWLSALVLAILLSGCATTSIISTWKAPDAAPSYYKKIVVVGIISEADRTIRENMEFHLAEDLQAVGYHALSAYQQYGPKAFEGMDEKQVTDKLAADSVEAVLTVVLLDKQKERYYVPGRVVYSPYTIYQNRFWGYYRSIYNRIETPGYYEERTKYFWESNFFDLKNHRLIYSVQTQSFDSELTNSLAHEYGQNIVKSLNGQGLLLKQQPSVLKTM
ncbi:MAG TPA: hypothetical protein VFQ73_11465 [Flavisolibacter sp.]|nr:hypothetical protein [Flavisolibacter sp.]